MRCAVYGCGVDNQTKGFSPDTKFFSFPKDKELEAKWKHICKRNDKFNVKTARICSKHFCDEDYERNLKHELLGYKPKKYRPLKKEAIPSKNLPLLQEKSPSRREERSKNRAQERKRKELIKTVLEEVNVSDGDRINFSISEYHAINEEVDLVDARVDVSTREIGVNTDTQVDDRDRIIASLQEKLKILEHRQDIIGKLFSSEQLKKLEGSKARVRWSVEDISKAIVIYSAGPRSYRLLLKKGYPFPAVSTLRSWLKKIQISPGILKSVFNIMKLSDMSTLDKVCVISFDEIKIRKCYLYDTVKDETLKPYSYAQVVMLRGLFKSWKQPIFYDYDFKLTKEKLFEIITFVESSGFQVVAMVSDLGGGNRSLHSELNVNHNNTSFTNPCNGEPVFVFADVPHLMKLIRNHFVDHGFIVNEKEINKTTIEELLEVTSTSDLRITHKISKESLNLQGAARQKVKHATKLFSHTISLAISRCGTMGSLKQPNWVECADFFKLVNDWFDILNVRVPKSDSRDRTKAYGLALITQDSILTKMNDTMENMRVKGKSTLLPFQKGVIMTNNSLRLLFEHLKARFSTKYLLTYRLNQDVLENFFGVIRAKGGLHDHPDALEFKYRLRSYILGRNEGSLSSFGNIEEDDTPDLPIEEVNLCGQYFSSVDENKEPEESTDSIALNSVDIELSDVQYDGLENLAGYICHKMNHLDTSTSTTSTSSYTWVSHLSEGGLSPEFMIQLEELEKIFRSVNKDSLLISKNYLKKLVAMSSHVSCEEKTKLLFFRSRMFFRMRQLNHDLQDVAISRKRKYKKIIK